MIDSEPGACRTGPTRRQAVAFGAAVFATWPVEGAAAEPAPPKWRIGDVVITRLADFEMTRDPAISVFPFATPELLASAPWLQPRFIDPAGLLRFNFQGFLIETRNRRILVDTGLGPRPPAGPAAMGLMMDALAAAGCLPGSIDLVIHTHLHPDHVGWDATTADGRAAPRFPHARYLIARAEYAYWSEDQADAAARQGFANALAPFWAARQLDLVDSNHKLTPEVRLTRTPGHTPGHVSVCIESGSERALITGDVLHHPVQFVRPDWDNPGDFDGGLATRTRIAMCEHVADKPILLIGSHFASPTAGRVKRDGQAYRFVA